MDYCVHSLDFWYKEGNELWQSTFLALLTGLVLLGHKYDAKHLASMQLTQLPKVVFCNLKFII